MNKNMNIKEATEKWVNGFNGIPLELIVKAYKDDIENIYEVTPITVGDRVWSNEEQEEMEVLEINVDEGTCEVVSYSDETFTLELGDISRENEDYFPMWGRMWTFGESIDNWWLEDEDNQRKMAECGFRIYECDELGYVFGIDGAGYSFYDEHWIPLYRARGLEWHDKE